MKIFMKKIHQNTYEIDRDYSIPDFFLEDLFKSIRNLLDKNSSFKKEKFEPLPFLEDGFITPPRITEGYVNKNCLTAIKFYPTFNYINLDIIICEIEKNVKNLEGKIKNLSGWTDLYLCIPSEYYKIVKEKSHYETERYIDINEGVDWKKQLSNKKLLLE